MLFAKHVIHWFNQRAEKDNVVIPLPKMMSLLYYSQCWYIEMVGYILFNNRIEAFEYGPVVPAVINYTNTDRHDYVELTKKQQIILEFVYVNYSHLTFDQLREFNKRKDGPWFKTVQKFGFFAAIDPDLMRSCFSKYRKEYLFVSNN